MWNKIRPAQWGVELVMELVDQIIELAVDDERSVSVLLRKCLVLAHELKNERLKTWAEKELNGYGGSDDEVPAYRKIDIIAKGNFRGPFNGQINNQPLPSVVLDKKDRNFAESATLAQPIISYEANNDES